MMKMKRFIVIWILVSAGLNIWQMDRIRDLEEKRPIVVYKADNQGAEIKGKAGMEAHRWCTTVEYLLRYREKNGLEDLKKARKNLDWLIEELEHEN